MTYDYENIKGWIENKNYEPDLNDLKNQQGFINDIVDREKGNEGFRKALRNHPQFVFTPEKRESIIRERAGELRSEKSLKDLFDIIETPKETSIVQGRINEITREEREISISSAELRKNIYDAESAGEVNEVIINIEESDLPEERKEFLRITADRKLREFE